MLLSNKTFFDKLADPIRAADQTENGGTGGS
jgi:hypothetical protein